MEEPRQDPFSGLSGVCGLQPKLMTLSKRLRKDYIIVMRLSSAGKSLRVNVKYQLSTGVGSQALTRSDKRLNHLTKGRTP